MSSSWPRRDRGQQQTITYTEGDLADPRLAVGDSIRVVRYDANGTATYAFADMDRTTLTWLLALVFAAVLLAVARWRGLASLAGPIVSRGLLVLYLLSRLLTGGSPVPTAVICGAAVVLIVLPLAHGWSARTAAALVGTLGGLAMCAALAGAATAYAHITGRSDEQVQALQGLGAQITVSGLVLCGAIIGGLGVLNDVTITQASAVFEVAAADERASVRQLFTAGMRVGRDHIASTVYKLVLAYAGSALPLLLLFNVTGRSFGEVITSDDLAGEIIRSWIGGVGLILAMPLTTLIAAALARPRTRSYEDDIERSRAVYLRSNSSAGDGSPPFAAISPGVRRTEHSWHSSAGVLPGVRHVDTGTLAKGIPCRSRESRWPPRPPPARPSWP